MILVGLQGCKVISHVYSAVKSTEYWTFMSCHALVSLCHLDSKDGVITCEEYYTAEDQAHTSPWMLLFRSVFVGLLLFSKWTAELR